MEPTEPCPICDRYDCRRFTAQQNNGWDFMYNDECDKHKVDWRRRARIAEAEVLKLYRRIDELTK